MRNRLALCLTGILTLISIGVQGVDDHEFTNRLIKEKSPYLLQHAHNPIDWYPWGDEAFAAAKKENKPILLSIGYSTCHWCHVMEEECFEDKEVAALMNKYFICVKVDREERPDLDAIYMDVARYLGNGGGWPLTIVMTPDRKPYVAGTYFPKHRKYNIDGLMTLLPVWFRWYRYNSSIMTENIQRVEQRIRPRGPKRAVQGSPDADLHAAADRILSSFNASTGGFGFGGSKFPRSHQLLALLEHYKYSQEENARNAVDITLKNIRNGGIFDQLGYGIHRYTVDPFWFIPHFEKMLYNQALLTMALSDYYAITTDEEKKLFAEQIFTYVLRDLYSEQGAFYSAEDADSEGEEGLFYLWTQAELKNLLSDDELAIFSEIYGVKKDGNWVDSATNEQQPTNILSITAEGQQKLSALSKEEQNNLDSARKKLMNERDTRIRPSLDDKILADWNGLMIASFAKAGRIFKHKKYLAVAEKAFGFILDQMYDGSILKHRWRDGEAAIDGMLADYTAMSWAALELYSATQNISYLNQARTFMDYVGDNFDDGTGIYNMTAHSSEKLLFKKQQFEDLAEPSGNSMAFLVYSELARFTGEQKYEKRAETLAILYARGLNYAPDSRTIALYTFARRQSTTFDIVLTGDPKDKQFQKIEELIKKHADTKNIYLITKTTENAKEVEETAPFTSSYTISEDKPVVYLCRDRACMPPTSDLKTIEKLLSSD